MLVPMVYICALRFLSRGAAARSSPSPVTASSAASNVAARTRLQWLWALTGAVLVMLAALTAEQTEVWRNNINFYEQELKVCQISGRKCSYNDLGLELQVRGDCARAIEVLEAGALEEPDSESIWLTLTACYAKEQRLADAMTALDTALTSLPGSAKLLLNKATTTARLCDIEQARQLYRRVLDVDSQWDIAKAGLANLESMQEACERQGKSPARPQKRSLKSPEPADMTLREEEEEERDGEAALLHASPEHVLKDDSPARTPAERVLSSLPGPVVITWPVIFNTGWGVFSRNLIRQMLKAGRQTPIVTTPLQGPSGWTDEMTASFSEEELQLLLRWQSMLFEWMTEMAVQSFSSTQLVRHLPLPIHDA
ncbi:hypothetical protein CYMTET_36130 [Cymbomonas tetramitiformis]|uniref:Uncharacterized protein n=1 Tax=Cymbomonas tetramitiformis TaxID=36881 RepID=A0AAE0F7M6_9CHLO|nr:hypothetical protein CYMTET_36130 [Cymbomonas tetramitiformis]